MKYYTVKPRLEFWHDYITWRTKWKPKYNLSQLSRDLGFQVSTISEILNQKYEKEISARLIATSMKVTGHSFEELWEIEEAKREVNTETPNKVKGQSFSVNGNGNENEYMVKEQRKYDFLMASSDFAERIGEGHKRTWYPEQKIRRKKV